jgi:putative FmdB family regulatory protein
MPTYDYRCAKCGEDLEVYQTFSEAPLTRHKGCGGKLSKVLSPAGIVLKGSGFYKTDNRSKAKRSGDTSGRDTGGKDSGSKDSPSTNGDSSAKADTKSEAKSSSDTKPSSSSSSSSSSGAGKPAAKSA